MNIYKKLTIFLFIMIFSLSFIFNGSTVSSKTDMADYAFGRLIVQFENSINEHSKANIRASLNMEKIKSIDNKGLELIRFNENRPIKSVINQLENMPGVVFAEPDYLITLDAMPDDDTYYSLLWGLNNTGQTINNISGDSITDIDAYEAWSISEGDSSVIVAVIDTAIDSGHPDLSGVVIDYQKFHKGPAVYDHGTHVAGTIAANDNQIGVIGIAPNIKIMSLAFLGRNGGYTSDAIEAINYAKNNGADLINASWGGGGYSQALKDAIETFGKPFIAAAGNDGLNTDSSPHYPSSYNLYNIISVASVNNIGLLSDFSNYGLNSVDIGAPGESIASTYPGGYAYMSGTSMAAPHVSGIVALMRSYNQTASTTELIDALYLSGKDSLSLSGITKTGKIANAYNALVGIGYQAPTDTNPPLLNETTPADTSTDIALDTEISLIFNEDVLFTDTYNTDDLTSIKVNGEIAQANVSNNKIVIIPASSLNYDTFYSVEVPSSIISDLSGNVYTDSILFTFTTLSDTQPPSQDSIYVLSTDPENESIGVRINLNISISFDQIFTLIDTSKISLVDSNNKHISFRALGENSQELKINPDIKLDTLTTYTVTIDEGAVNNSNLNSVPYIFSFTTGTK